MVEFFLSVAARTNVETGRGERKGRNQMRRGEKKGEKTGGTTRGEERGARREREGERGITGDKGRRVQKERSKKKRGAVEACG